MKCAVLLPPAIDRKILSIILNIWNESSEARRYYNDYAGIQCLWKLSVWVFFLLYLNVAIEMLRQGLMRSHRKSRIHFVRFTKATIEYVLSLLLCTSWSSKPSFFYFCAERMCCGWLFLRRNMTKNACKPNIIDKAISKIYLQHFRYKVHKQTIFIARPDQQLDSFCWPQTWLKEQLIYDTIQCYLK